MADGLNRVILIGNLGADPELKYTQGNQAVLRLRLATTESYLSKTGERQQRTRQTIGLHVAGRAGIARNLLKSENDEQRRNENARDEGCEIVHR